MAHYAILDNNNVVVNVIVGKDENEPTPEGYSSWEEYYGGVRTSYNTVGNKHLNGGTPFRKNYGSIGFTYDAQADGFYPPKPYPSWKLNYETFLWEPPIEMPEHIDFHKWIWSEVNQEWVSIKVL